MKSALTWIAAIGFMALAVAALLLVARRTGSTTISKPDAGHTAEHVSDYGVVREFPHDKDAYTQGLIYLDGFLYETTGITGKSTLRKVRLETGEVVQKRDVNRGDYGEGLTEWKGQLFHLTPRRRGNAPPWHVRKFAEDLRRHFGDNIGVIYDIRSLEPRSTFGYPGEGWGITHDDKRLIMSDGSSKLRFLKPDTFEELNRLEVFEGSKPVDNLNELEFVDGKIYANISQQDRIAVIDPDSGQVTRWIDLSALKSRMPPLPEKPLRAVLNGIAYDAAGHRLFVTGKLWPKVFEIQLPEK